MNQAQQLAGQMAQNGTIEVEVESPEVQNEFGSEICLNIREDSIMLFEDENGRQYLQTDEMATGVYIAPIPTANGFEPEVVIEPEFELTETETASLNDTESPSIGGDPEIRMD